MSPISSPNLELMRRPDTVETPKSGKVKLDPINGTIRCLRKDRNCKKVGAVGFCNGAARVIRALSNDPGVSRVDTRSVAHPADVTANLLQGVQGPLSIASADDDPNVRHSFAVRRAITTKAEVYAKKQAFVQAVQWFEEHLIDEE
jgi:dienelactone hydrolase